MKAGGATCCACPVGVEGLRGCKSKAADKAVGFFGTGAAGVSGATDEDCAAAAWADVK